MPKPTQTELLKLIKDQELYIKRLNHGLVKAEEYRRDNKRLRERVLLLRLELRAIERTNDSLFRAFEQYKRQTAATPQELI